METLFSRFLIRSVLTLTDAETEVGIPLNDYSILLTVPRRAPDVVSVSFCSGSTFYVSR